jgi:hypothetical protein
VLIKDPSRLPSADEVDRHLGPFTRYARIVRGGARTAGLSARLQWTQQGWVETLTLGELLVATLQLAPVPPRLEVGVSKAMFEAMASFPLPEVVKKAIADAEGTAHKWIVIGLAHTENAEAAVALLSLKAQLLQTSAVPPWNATDKFKPIQRPVSEVLRPVSRPGEQAAKPTLRAVEKPPEPVKPPEKPAAKPAVKAAEKPLEKAAAPAKAAAPEKAEKAEMAVEKPKAKSTTQSAARVKPAAKTAKPKVAAKPKAAPKKK